MSKKKEKKTWKDYRKKSSTVTVYFSKKDKKKFQLFCFKNDIRMSEVAVMLVNDFLKKPSLKKLKKAGILEDED